MRFILLLFALPLVLPFVFELVFELRLVARLVFRFVFEFRFVHVVVFASPLTFGRRFEKPVLPAFELPFLFMLPLMLASELSFVLLRGLVLVPRELLPPELPFPFRLSFSERAIVR